MKRSTLFLSDKKIAASPSLCGLKAKHLAFLRLKGFNVPPFIVVSADSSLDFAKETDRQAFTQYIKQALREKGIEFPNAKIAVRSSAPYEDAHDSSLAGQLESILDVTTEEKLIDAVRTVKASEASDKITSYGRRVRGEKLQAQTAIILQLQIDPEISGVLFTSHPLSHQELMVIEVVKGPCSHLVAGRTSPKQLIIAKTDQSIIDQADGDYADLVVPTEIIKSLIQMGTKIEDLFHRPMDIEWGYAHNRLWLFQARPITGFQQTKIRIDQQGIKWTNYFFAERFDRPVSPLVWSFLFPLISRRALADPLWYLGKEKLVKRGPLITQFEGFPYTRLDAFLALYSVIPLRLIPTEKRRLFIERNQGNFFSLCRSLPALIGRLLIQDPQWIPWVNLQKWRRLLSACQLHIKQLNEKLEEADPNGLWIIWETTRRLSDQFLYIHRWSITFADLFTELLRLFLQFTLAGGNQVQELLSGLPQNASVEAETALDALDIDNIDHVKNFIDRYGHRSQSLDFSLPTWGESLYVLKKSRISGTSESLLEKNRAISLRHKELLISLQKALETKFGLTAFLFKPLFRLIYRTAAQFVSCRENQRDLWQKILYISRRTALKIGQNLQNEGVLTNPQEVFFLQHREIRALIQGKKTVSFSVQARKARFEKYTKSEDYSYSHEANSETRSAEHAVLLGMGVSSGKIIGKARVVHTFEEALSAQRDEIIVAPAVDPGWTPVFARISGLILEYGGMLSHAAIIAREFYLPAVTGIQDAATKIKTGDLISLDGQYGIVKILHKPS